MTTNSDNAKMIVEEAIDTEYDDGDKDRAAELLENAAQLYEADGDARNADACRAIKPS